MRNLYITLFVLGFAAFEIVRTSAVPSTDECENLVSCDACQNNSNCAFVVCPSGEFCHVNDEELHECEKKTECGEPVTSVPNLDDLVKSNDNDLDDMVKSNDNEICSEIVACDECEAANCTWIHCEGYENCDSKLPELCSEQPCTTTTTNAPPISTTTEPPSPATTAAPNTTTAEPPSPTTTEPPSPTTTEPPSPTTTEPPSPSTTTTEPTPTTTDITTVAPNTTTEPATTTSTTSSTSTSTTPSTSTVTPCPDPEPRHFDAASFFGGMMLAVAIIAIAYAAWKFYKTRNVRNYLTLHETVHM